MTAEPNWAGSAAPPPRGFTALPTFRLRVLARLLERHSDRWFQARFALSLAEIRVIAITGSARQITLKHLAREAELDRGQASRLVTGLVERGLIARTEHPSDQRSTILVLTGAGRALYPALLAAAEARNHAWLAGLPEAERRTLMDNVERLIGQLRGEIEAEPPPAHEMPEPPDGDALTIEAAQARQLRDLLNRLLGDTAE